MRPTLEQLGLEVGCIATEVDVRALSKDKRVRFVEGVTAWGMLELGGEPLAKPPIQQPPSPHHTQGVWGCGADVSCL